MAEVGIDITGEYPKPWTDEIVRAADVVVTMGCGDACPFYPGKRYEDWALEDPAGQGIEAVRPIRDEIRERVTELLKSLDVDVDVTWRAFSRARTTSAAPRCRAARDRG